MAPSCWPRRKWTGCWWVARRSTRLVGPRLCGPARLRYYLRSMFTFLKIILLLDALILTTAVLLQAGRGGGPAPLGAGPAAAMFLGVRPAPTLLHNLPPRAPRLLTFLTLPPPPTSPP